MNPILINPTPQTQGEVEKAKNLAHDVNTHLNKMGKVSQIAFLRIVCPGLHLKDAKEIIDRQEFFDKIEGVISKLEEVANNTAISKRDWSYDHVKRLKDVVTKINNMI